VEVALVAEVVALDPWTTETATLEELAQELPERVVAALLKVISAHWPRSQQGHIRHRQVFVPLCKPIETLEKN
jgi:hypothetical protein